MTKRDMNLSTLNTTTIELRNAALGQSPTGFSKMHVELLPSDLSHLVGYDPRTLGTTTKRRKRSEMVPMNVASSVVILQQNVQRSIDQSRVDQMVDYLHAAITRDEFADWAEIDVVTAAKPDTADFKENHIIRMPASANYFITDGQHRFCALLDFMQKYPELSDTFTQAVAISVLPEDRVFEYAGQAFHDKNYLHAPVKIAKALHTDVRDLHNRLAKELHTHPAIVEAGGISYQRDTLPPISAEFTTHSVLYRFVRGFTDGKKGLDKGQIADSPLYENFDELRDQIFSYVTNLAMSFPSWKAENRENYLFRSSAAFQAFGVIGHDLNTFVGDPTIRNAMVSRIGEKRLDWKRTNVKEWDGVIGLKNKQGVISPASSHQAIDATIKFLREKSGLTEYMEPDTSE